MSAEEKIKIFSEEFERMPGVTVIHDIDGFKPLFMTSNGLQILGVSLEELIAVKEEYQDVFFNKNFMADYLHQLKNMISREDLEETYTVFHEVKVKQELLWYASSVRVFHVNQSRTPTHTITYAVPLEDYKWTIKRAQRLQQETEFARKNLQKFALLSRREKQVLALTAQGKRTAEMAEFLSVTAETISSHLKSIRKKLESGSSYELNKFALAFDLL